MEFNRTHRIRDKKEEMIALLNPRKLLARKILRNLTKGKFQQVLRD
jgi:hypothetical protein